MHCEVHGNLFGLWASSVDLDIKHASADTFWIDSTHLNGGIEYGDVFALASNRGNGIGGHVVPHVLEVGDKCHCFSRDKAAGPIRTSILKNGLARSDEGLTVPCMSSVGHLHIDLESGAVFNAFCNDETESVLQNDGFFSGQHIKLSSTTEDAQTFVIAGQGNRSVAISRVNAHILEAHGQTCLYIDRSEVGRIVVHCDIGSFSRKDFDRHNLGNLVITHDGKGSSANITHRGEAEGACAVFDVT